MGDAVPHLYWKYEDGPENAVDKDLNDVGPIWLERPNGSGEKLKDGEWVTRAEARKMAEDLGYELDEDE